MRKAFTLVETLVAAATFAVLAATLVPALAHAAGGPTVLGNFEKVGKGVLQYAVDNDDRAPFFYGYSTPAEPNPYRNPNTWVGRVYPYVGERQAFFDPTASLPKPDG